MNLDLPTLLIMESFVPVCAGAVLLIAWSHNRKIFSLALWGLADLAVAGGILSLMLGAALRQPLWSLLGGVLFAIETGLMWKAARAFDAKPAPLRLAFLGAVVVSLAGSIPVIRQFGGSISLATASIYLFATATTLWLGRKERLTARSPLIVLTAVHAAVLLIGSYSTLIGSTGQDAVPAVLSLFGFIHFESVIFSLGTAAFLLALVKERNEVAGMTAARTDSLTGIANRTAFLENASRVLERCRRDSAPISAMMFDLDRFKAINDRHGHAVGDAVIQKFCQIVTTALRPSDVFGRVGGEEFAVVLPGSSIEAAWARAERIRASFAENCRFVRGHQVNATVSGGVSVSVNGEQTLEALLEHSDVALYEAKTEGRNRIKRADPTEPEAGPSNVFRVA
jgi:diguanylate cyclase (GGDEF)-like protein